MAELIDKGSLVALIEKEKKTAGETAWGQGYWSGLAEAQDFALNLPSVTEAEIRAKAYDKFLTEMLNEFDSKNADNENHTGSYVVSRLHKIAEQLKEE